MQAVSVSLELNQMRYINEAWSWTRRRHLRDHKHSRLSSYLQQLLQADLEEYGNDRRLFIYILICIYEAISLMLSLVTCLWVKVLSLVYTNRPSQQLQSHDHGFSSCILAPRCCKE